MKFSFAIALFAATVATVAASPAPADTNANRMARGLPPMPPSRRATPVAGARRSSPSNSPSSCNTGPIQCCNSTTTVSSGLVGILEGLIGILIPIGTVIGQNCSPISAVGVGGNSCTQQPICCENNSFNGLIAIGCSPININL